MHRRWVVAFDKIGFVAVSGQQRHQLFPRDAGRDGGICDLVAIHMEYRQNGPVANRIQELVGVPGSRERTSLGLAIADYDGDDEIGIVERRSISVGKRVAKFAAFVNRAGRLWRAVRADSARKGKLLEELEHARFIAALVRINFGIVTLEITVGERGRRAVTGAGDVNDIKIVLLDEPVEMNPNQGLAGIGTPVAKQPILDVLRLERLAQQGIGAEIDHAGRKIIAGSPVGIYLS